MVPTSGRADRTPLHPVISALRLGCHTVTELALDGAPPHRCAKLTAKELRNKYDVLLALGDRHEMLAAVLAATVARVPVAHIHGGEASFGSFDNQLRDAISKIAHVHFVAGEPMRQRLADIGEQPWRIHVVGAPGLDNLASALRQERKPEKVFLLTYHPATISPPFNAKTLVDALSRFSDYRVLWTGVNNDPGSERIRTALSRHYEAQIIDAEMYHHVMRQSAVVVGNSSSGIIEAPTLGVPTVNIGPRQDGRVKGPSIIDCAEDTDAIELALRKALDYDGPFDNPYGGPGASARIAKILPTANLNLVKRWS